MKKRITSILNNKFSENFITILVILNILVFYCGIDGLIQNFRYIEIFDMFSMLIFTCEYSFRLIILEKPSDFFKPMLFLDLLSILPYYIAVLPFKTTFLRLITGYGDFAPAGSFSRLLDPIIIIIGAGIHGLIVDVAVPVYVKAVKQRKG